MALTKPQLLFLSANIVLGALIALAAARIPSFAALPVPQFGWLVVGVLLTDIAIGYMAGAHPTAVITMPVRIAALALSFFASLIVASALAA